MIIYLIDEQENRQREYGWNKEKFSQYNFLNVHSTSESIDYENLLSADVVLLHESFPDEKLKQDLYKLNQENRKFGLVVFSGSKNERKQNENRLDMPVSVFYNHLHFFLEPILEGENPNAQNLLYGKNPNIEKEILEEIIKRNDEENTENIEAKSNEYLLISSENNAIESPFNNIEELVLYSQDNEDFSDKQFDTIVKENLSENQYDKIYIPLCFGNVLSDFNGLRLAMHIRCTPTPNQLSTIFIYGVLPLDRLIDNPYFDVLKTKNVFYIDYNKKSLQEAENKLVEVFSAEELSTEIKKINLEAPKDNHSIANEWAIYRWAKSIQANDEDIEKINQKIEYNLYYKYLQMIYPISDSNDLQDIKIELANEKPKVLYIDDEHEKGWNEIFATILYDKNKIDFESLETDFSASQEEIIEIALEKIKEKDIDTVILDFRLHKFDFHKDIKIEDITSVKLLQEIKKINAGIQVIFFSATNKIWNLQKLQEFGADGFIIKESPENSINPHFTSETILQFKNTMETAFKRRFLKRLFLICDEIQQNIENVTEKYSDEFDKFLNDLKVQLKIIKIGLKNIDLKNKMSLDIVFLSVYNFMEKFKEFYFRKDKKDHKYYIGEENGDAKNYYFDKNNQFVEEEHIQELTWFSAMANLFIDYFEICDKYNPIIEELNKVKEKRNKYIHEDKPYFDEKELLLIFSLCKEITSKLKD